MPAPPKPRKPLAAVAPSVLWISRVILPNETAPAGLPGLILLNAVPYMLAVNGETRDDGPPVIHGFRFIKANGEFHDVCTEGHKACSCGDGTFRDRPGGCKHIVALTLLGLEQDDTGPEPEEDAFASDPRSEWRYELTGDESPQLPDFADFDPADEDIDVNAPPF
jgi:hypothetical protein